jgi:hypothetical protein
MRSLSSRLLVSVSVLLLLFFGVTIAVLDTAFSEAGEQWTPGCPAGSRRT